MARIEILQAWTKSRRSKASMAVYPGDSNLICDWLAEFPSVLMKQKIELLPTEGDRAAFQLGPEQWTDFLRRLGIDQDHEEEQEL